jgi:hypothetical protein
MLLQMFFYNLSTANDDHLLPMDEKYPSTLTENRSWGTTSHIQVEQISSEMADY